MNVTMSRIQCLELSAQIQTKFSALKMTDEQIGEVLVKFAVGGGDSGIEPRMAALEIAVRLANVRAGLENVMIHAHEIMEFAEPKKKPAPKPEQKQEPQKPAQSRQKGRGRTSR